jgi:hypothetical protein
MHNAAEIAERIRALLLGGSFDLRCFGDYLNKRGDGDYIIEDASATNGNVEVRCIGTNIITIVAPENVSVTDEGVEVIDAPRVVCKRGNEVFTEVFLEGADSVAHLPSGTRRLLKVMVDGPIFEMVRVSWGTSRTYGSSHHPNLNETAASIAAHLGHNFDLRLLGEYVSKPDDGEYQIVAVSVRDTALTISFIGGKSMTVTTPVEVAFNDNAIAFNAPEILITGDGTTRVYLEGDDVVAALPGRGERRLRRAMLELPMVELMRPSRAAPR